MSPAAPPPRRDADDGPAPGDPVPRVRSSAAATVLATLAVIAALWWGQRFLIPLTAGLMLVMLVMPLNTWMTRALRSAVAATLLSLLLVMAALMLGAMAFGGQLVRVAERTPDMISMATQRLAERDPGADSLLTRARLALQELDRAADRMLQPEPPVRPKRRTTTTTTTTTVATVPASASAPANSITEGATVALRETAVTGSSVLLAFAGNLSIIFFIAFFVLTGGAPLTERFLGLWGHDPQVHARARQALLESGRQIRIYGGVLLVTNTVIGIAVWIAFSLAELPDAAGWGAAAAVLHVIPYLGMALLTVLGAAETFLAHGTPGAALGMAGFVVLLSTLVGTLGAAWLQGHAARMNAATVFIGLVFWGALWGIWGLFLGPALVVLIKVVAEHSGSGGRLAQLMKA